jgi:hypothetical protein
MRVTGLLGCKEVKYLPITMAQFSQMLERPSNRNSLRNLLPIPFISHNRDTEHAMCNLTEVVAMTMLLSPSDAVIQKYIDRYASVTHSQSFFEHRRRIPTNDLVNNSITKVMVYIIIWSDGWDPNRSNKGNRYPIWTATGTLIFIEISAVDTVYLVSTQLLCAAPGKSSHNAFFEMLRDEKLNN